MSAAVRAVSALLAGGLVAALTLRLLSPRRGPRWERSNYRGRQVHLAAGPALALGCLTGAAFAADLRGAVAVTVAGAVAAVAGAYDDFSGSTAAKGLRGHVTALVRGEVTSGALKVPALAIAGLGAGVAVHGVGGRAVLDGLLVAGAANLVNLLDLRPGRAAKVAFVAAALCLGLGGFAAAAAIGALAAVLPADLGERVMMGDTGANAVGAMVTAAVLPEIQHGTLLVALVIVVGLTLLSEVVSFSRVIDRTPPLRWLDRLGRAA